MNGYELNARLRAARQRYKLSAIDQAVYHELGDRCNLQRWPEVFEVKTEDIKDALNLSVPTYNISVKTLAAAGLLFFQKGNGKGNGSQYSFTKAFEKGKSPLPFSGKNQSQKGKSVLPFPPLKGKSVLAFLGAKGTNEFTLLRLKGKGKGKEFLPFSGSTPYLSFKTENSKENNVVDASVHTHAHTRTHEGRPTPPKPPLPPKPASIPAPAQPLDPNAILTIEEHKAEILTDQEMLGWAFQQGITTTGPEGPDDLIPDVAALSGFLDQFNAMLRVKLKFSRSREDYRSHFTFWFPKRPRPNTTNDATSTKNPGKQSSGYQSNNVIGAPNTDYERRLREKLEQYLPPTGQPTDYPH